MSLDDFDKLCGLKKSQTNPCTIWCIPSQASRPPQSRPSGFFINVWLRYIPIPSVGLVYSPTWMVDFYDKCGQIYTINHTWMPWDRVSGWIAILHHQSNFWKNVILSPFWVTSRHQVEFTIGKLSAAPSCLASCTAPTCHSSAANWRSFLRSRRQPLASVDSALI